MVMKDKLYKNNHKGEYYKKRIGIFAGIVLLSGVISICVPTYISHQKETSAKAEKVEKPIRLHATKTIGEDLEISINKRTIK